MSEPTEEALKKLREAFGRCSVRVESDGAGEAFRFTFTGGEHGRDALRLGHTLRLPVGRDNVAPGLIPPLGKTHFIGQYDKLAESCWPSGTPSVEAVRLQVQLCSQDVVDAARRAVVAYNSLYHLSATVASALPKEADTAALAEIWARVVDAVSGPPGHVAVLFDDWQQEVVRLAQTAPASSVLSPAVHGATREGKRHLDVARRQLGRMVAREIIAKQFARWAEECPRPEQRPRESKLWKWPWTERKAGDVLLGLIAMHVFENTSGDPERWDPETWPYRESFRFVHATAEQQGTNPGRLLNVRERWLGDPEPGEDAPRLVHREGSVVRELAVRDILAIIARRWQIFRKANGDADSDGDANGDANMDSLRRTLRRAVQEQARVGRLFERLRRAERAAGLVKREEEASRYCINAHAMTLTDFLPLLAAVAVDYEEDEKRPFAVASLGAGTP